MRTNQAGDNEKATLTTSTRCPSFRKVHFTLSPEQMSLVNDVGQWQLEPGEFKVWVGGQQPDLNGETQMHNILAGQFIVQN